MSAILDACARIRDAVSLASIAARSVKLIKAGREWKGCCPFHPDRSPSFTIYADDRRFICFGCSAQGDALDFVRRLHGVGLVEAIHMIDGGALPVVQRVVGERNREPEPARTEEAEAIWRDAVEADGTPAARYLASRGLGGPVPDVLRFARLRYGTRGELHPVMVALIVDRDGVPQGIQRTYLNAAGTGKAAVPKAKLSLGRVKGGAVRLAPAGRAVIVTEGIEDALTLQRGTDLPAWAAAGAGMLSAMLLPPHVREVTIGADADETGERSAQQARSVFLEQGRSVRILRPMPGCKDFNQELLSGSAVAA